MDIQRTLIDFGTAVGIGLGVTGILLLVGHALLKWLRRPDAPTGGRARELLVEALPRPMVLLSVAGGLAVALTVAALPPRVEAWGYSAFDILVIVALTLAISDAATRSVRFLGQRADIETAATGLGAAAVRALVFVLGGLMILSALGIAVTPLLAALGIGGLAVGLALRDTLSNLFAGVHLLMDKPLHVGDYVRLEGGQEGTVIDIGWRTTKLRVSTGTLAIVPNAKLAESILLNFSSGGGRVTLQLPVSVGPTANPESVERILVEEARRAAEVVPGLLLEPAPRVRLQPGGADADLALTLIIPARTSVDQQQAQHELRKRIFGRFQREGIEVRGWAAAAVGGGP